MITWGKPKKALLITTFVCDVTRFTHLVTSHVRRREEPPGESESQPMSRRGEPPVSRGGGGMPNVADFYV